MFSELHRRGEGKNGVRGLLKRSDKAVTERVYCVDEQEIELGRGSSDEESKLKHRIIPLAGRTLIVPPSSNAPAAHHHF